MARSLGSFAANEKGAKSAYKTLTESKLLSGFHLNQLSDMKTNEVIARTGMQEIDVGSPEFVDFYAAMPSMLLSSSFDSKKTPPLDNQETQTTICKLSEIGQDNNNDDNNNNNLNYVQAIKDGEFAFYVLKIQGKFYKMTAENMVELSIFLLPDSLKEMLKQFGMSEIELRKMLASKFNHAKQ